MFDTNTETISTLSNQLPVKMVYAKAFSYGNNIYLIGGDNNKTTIRKFDSTTKTTTTLSITMPSDKFQLGAAQLNNYVYIIGPNADDYILKFDMATETLTTLGVKFPTEIYKQGVEIAIGTNIYTFGGQINNGTFNKDIIYKFDTVAEIVTTLNVKLPSSITQHCGVNINDNVYLFGGSSFYPKKIYKFNGATETLETLDIENLYATTDSAAIAIGGVAYIFGGSSSTNILKFIP